MDRDNWSSFSNFVDMYDNIYNEMLFAGVAEGINQPIWVDREGLYCKEEDSYGRMITYRLLHPDNCFVADEVGANTSQKGDGRNGGERFVTEKGSTVKIRCSTKDHHFTLMGITALTGDPVMCVVIFLAKKQLQMWNLESIFSVKM